MATRQFCDWQKFNLSKPAKNQTRKKLVLQKPSGAVIWPAIKWISVLCINKTEYDYIQEINYLSFFFKYTYKRCIVEVIIFTNRQINKSEEKRLHLRLKVGILNWNKYFTATRSLAIYSAIASKWKESPIRTEPDLHRFVTLNGTGFDNNLFQNKYYSRTKTPP